MRAIALVSCLSFVACATANGPAGSPTCVRNRSRWRRRRRRDDGRDPSYRQCDRRRRSVHDGSHVARGAFRLRLALASRRHIRSRDAHGRDHESSSAAPPWRNLVEQVRQLRKYAGRSERRLVRDPALRPDGAAGRRCRNDARAVDGHCRRAARSRSPANTRTAPPPGISSEPLRRSWQPGSTPERMRRPPEKFPAAFRHFATGRRRVRTHSEDTCRPRTLHRQSRISSDTCRRRPTRPGSSAPLAETRKR